MNAKIDTIVRTIVLVFALINQVLTVMGYPLLPITEEEINELATLLLTVCASLWAWWKNNSFTENAVIADDYLKELKEGNL